MSMVLHSSMITRKGGLALIAIMVLCCSGSAQDPNNTNDMAFYRPDRIQTLDELEPDRKHFSFAPDGFQPIRMDATALRPFDGSDPSTIIPEHLERPELLELNGAVVRFNAWSDDIPEEGLSLLHELARELIVQPGVVVRIEAHTDNVGDPNLNRSLSQKWADRIKSELEMHGINPARLTAVGYGDRFPIASNSECAGRMKNRRAEFRFMIVTDH